MTNPIQSGWIRVVPLGLLLSACSGADNFSDLQNFVTDVRSRPGAQVEPVPEFIPYEGFIYSAASQRSPFQAPIQIDDDGLSGLSQDVEPDFEREREELEEFPLGELSMVGVLTRRGENEALIEDSRGEVRRVSPGSYLGRNFGRIETITERQINIIEIVPSGSGGWVERPQTLTLQ